MVTLTLFISLSILGWVVYKNVYQPNKARKAFRQINSTTRKLLDKRKYYQVLEMLELGQRLQRAIKFDEEIKCQIELSQFRDLIREYNRIVEKLNGGSGSRTNRRRSTRTSKGYPRNAYKILGLNHPATEKEIKSAYRRLCLIHHPDKPTGSKSTFIQVEKCYTVAMKFIGAK
jgi:DnaJ-domain-containing protein 1